jgi:hypothetical protein
MPCPAAVFWQQPALGVAFPTRVTPLMFGFKKSFDKRLAS